MESRVEGPSEVIGNLYSETVRGQRLPFMRSDKVSFVLTLRVKVPDSLL